MPNPICWTDADDKLIQKLRKEGASWDYIAEWFGVSRDALQRHARTMGVKTLIPRRPKNPVAEPKPMLTQFRAPLPPGHPVTWGLLTREPFPASG